MKATMKQSIAKKRQWISQYENSDTSYIIDSGDNHSSGARCSQKFRIKPRHIVLAGISVLVLMTFLGDRRHLDKYVESLRRRALLCYKTPYLTSNQAVNDMPEVSDESSNNKLQGVRGYDSDLSQVTEDSKKPTYISLCEELVSRNQNAMKKEQTHEALSPLMDSEMFVIREHQSVCRNWASPHESLMEMIASQVVAYAGFNFGLKYDHDCHKFIPLQNKYDFDVTTIQEIYPQLPLRLDERIVRIGDVIWTLCDSCIAQYKSNQESTTSPSAHHCLLFPEHRDDVISNRFDTSHLKVEGAEAGAEELNWDGRNRNLMLPPPNALESALTLIKNRLYHAAVDYAKKSDIPDHDPKGGATIYIDQSSMAIPYHVFVEQMPNQATHISIIAGPKCVETKLKPTNIQCIDYATQLRTYMEKHFGVGDAIVSFNLVGSTATVFSRLILTHNLLCPPGTLPCLLPALARQSAKETIIIENVDESNTFHFFSKLSQHAENIKIIPLSQNDVYAEDQDQVTISKNSPLNEIPQRVEGNSEGTRFGGNVDTGLPSMVTNEDEGFHSVELGDETELGVETELVKLGQRTSQNAIKPIDLSKDGIVESEGTSANDVLFSMGEDGAPEGELQNKFYKVQQAEEAKDGEGVNIVQPAEVSPETPVLNTDGEDKFDLAFENFGNGGENEYTMDYTKANNTTDASPEINMDHLFGGSSVGGGRFGGR